jgi:hypothetical protein
MLATLADTSWGTRSVPAHLRFCGAAVAMAAVRSRAETAAVSAAVAAGATAMRVDESALALGKALKRIVDAAGKDHDMLGLMREGRKQVRRSGGASCVCLEFVMARTATWSG